MICTCVPYEWNWSQDVEKRALDLVLSSFTHTNAVQAIALASKECCFFLQCPLAGAGWIWMQETFNAEAAHLFTLTLPLSH